MKIGNSEDGECWQVKSEYCFRNSEDCFGNSEDWLLNSEDEVGNKNIGR